MWSWSQLWTIFAAATRELIWGLPAVAKEVKRWQRRALIIPEPALREDALDALVRKRENIEGAAFLWILLERRSFSLLRLLAGYEAMSDYLDSTNERAAHAGVRNGRVLHRALVDALDARESIRDYYLHHPWHDDAGYLETLVRACREVCTFLPAYPNVKILAVRAAKMAGIQALNHDVDSQRRIALLQDAAVLLRRPNDESASWFERTAAASAWITVLALLVMAADPGCDERRSNEVFASYFWVSLTAAMLDSYADLAEDDANDGHSYLSHYESHEAAIRRIRELIGRTLCEARALPNAHRHVVVVASMIAMYLSKDPARSSATRNLASAGGRLTRLLLVGLRLWRKAYNR